MLVADDAHTDGAQKGRSAPAPALFVVAGIAAGALIAGAGWLATSLLFAGGEENARAERDAANLLAIFTTSQDGSSERFEGELPPGFPDDVPLYEGARVISSSRQFQAEDIAYFVLFDTGDARADVAGAFEELFDSDDWQIEAGEDGRDYTLHRFSKTDDPDVTGLVLAAQSRDDKLTTILLTVQIASGADAGARPEFTPSASRQLPSDFPGDVPQYPGWTVLQSAFQKEAGSRTFLLSFITEDDTTDVLDFYRDEFTDNGWLVEDSDASDSSALEDAEAISFNDDASEIGGQVIAGEFGADASFTQVDLQLQERSSRESDN